MRYRRLLPLAVLAAALTVVAGAGDTTFLTGETIVLDASTTEGHPSGYQWFVTPPGGTEPAEPDGTNVTFDLLLDAPGSWTIRLVALYDHQAPQGGLYRSEATQTVQASSVVANLSLPGEPVPLDREIVLDGSGSRIASGVTPTVTWTVEGPEPYTGCPGELICTIPADTFTEPGTYTVTLTLEGGGDTDTATGTFEVIDDTVSVDFTWSQSGPNPRNLSFDATLSPPLTSASQSEWDFGDGTGIHTYSCQYTDCMTGILHTYETDGVYTVNLTVTTGAGDHPTATHTVVVGDPVDPPTAGFSFTPETGVEPLADVIFTFTGTCEGDCSWSWDFGEGTTAHGNQVTHSFPRSGAYDVVLTVTNISGSDTSEATVTVTDCWTPPEPTVQGTIVPTTVCWGDTLIASYGADVGTAFLWSTGSTDSSANVSEGGAFWVTVDDGTPCRGTRDFTVTGINCGDAGHDVNLDGTVDGDDLSAILLELIDGDGNDVASSGGGFTLAPGGDGNSDGVLDPADLLAVLEVLFSDPAP